MVYNMNNNNVDHLRALEEIEAYCRDLRDIMSDDVDLVRAVEDFENETRVEDKATKTYTIGSNDKVVVVKKTQGEHVVIINTQGEYVVIITQKDSVNKFVELTPSKLESIFLSIVVFVCFVQLQCAMYLFRVFSCSLWIC